MASTRSPFPGMDPYLETHWQAVHAIFIAETWRTLNRLLPGDLSATVEERVAVESDEDRRQLRAGPDVFVFHPSTGPWDKSAGGAVVIDAPYRMVVDSQPIIERFVRIINQDGQLITVVEFISPANKRQPGLDAFLAKRSDLLEAGVHIVEIDLVRAGNWKALFQPHVCTQNAVSLYRVTIRIAVVPATAYLYPIRLQEPLPEIQIPLRLGDPKLMLPLQPMIETIYADGRYGKTLDYTQPLDPPLSADDQQYASRLISAGG
jgi:hypothetical protein